MLILNCHKCGKICAYLENGSKIAKRTILTCSPCQNKAGGYYTRSHDNEV